MKNLSEVIQDIKQNISSDSRVVFVSGNFNIVHPGHLRLLRFARECGDFLVVGVQSNRIAGQSVWISEENRLESVDAVSWVDYAFVMDTEAKEVIGELKPDIVVKGREHENAFNPESEAVKKYGGALLFGSGDVSFSSLSLLRKEYEYLNSSTISKPLDYLKRHNITMSDLAETLEKFKELEVIVIGDSIVDQYIDCDPIGMSREEPTIVVTPIMNEIFIGGAAITAAHASMMGAKVNFFSIAGNDRNADFLKENLKIYKVSSTIIRDSSRPTTLKQRFRAEGKSLLRVNTLHQHDINSDIRDNIKNKLIPMLAKAKLLIFSDFNYGCLPQVLVDEITEECFKHNVMIAADSQSSSQTGDIGRYKNSTLLTPTEHEARIATRDSQSGLVVLAEKLRKEANAQNIFLTLGEEGIMIHAGLDHTWETDRLPAMNSAPKDVAGAGDSLLTVSSMALAAGCDIWQAAYLGSLAAAHQVGRVGNTPLVAQEFIREIEV